MKEKKKTAPAIRFPEFTTPWEQRKLGEIGSTFTGLSGKTKEDFGHGDARFVTYMNVYSNSIADLAMTERVEIDQTQNSVKYGDIFFTTSSETPNEVGMSSVWLGNTENTYLNSFCFGYRPEVKVNPYYMAYMLRSPNVRNKLIILAQGISRYNISKNRVMDIEVPTPDLSEQKEIGQYFFNLDHLITLHQRKEDSLKELKKGMMQKLFSQELRFKDDDGHDYPTWKKRKIGDIFDYIIDKNHPNDTVLTIRQGEGTVPRSESGIDIQFNRQSLDGYKKVMKDDFIVHLRSFQGGLEIANSDGIVSPAYTILRSKISIDSKFYQEYFHTDEFIHHNLSFVVEGVRDGRTINTKDLKKRFVPVPSLPEQKKIAQFLSSLDAKIDAAHRQTEALQTIKKGFLQKMFI